MDELGFGEVADDGVDLFRGVSFGETGEGEDIVREESVTGVDKIVMYKSSKA